jgi:hypothetical protein
LLEEAREREQEIENEKLNPFLEKDRRFKRLFRI